MGAKTPVVWKKRHPRFDLLRSRDRVIEVSKILSKKT
jgi:hypothetical protein